MCGRFTLRTPAPVLIQNFRLQSLPELVPRYNIAPSQQVAAVRAEWPGSRDAQRGVGSFPASTERPVEWVPTGVWMRWGLIPSWSRDPSSARPLINARSETAAEKPSFRSAFRHRRCLVLADGYYEWQASGRNKQPFYIHLPDHVPFGMAGLWEVWSDRTGQPPLVSCTILTQPAQAATRAIHDRMPVVLAESTWNRWLDPQQEDAELLTPLLTAGAAARWHAEPVGHYVNNARHEGPACLQPPGSDH